MSIDTGKRCINAATCHCSPGVLFPTILTFTSWRERRITSICEASSIGCRSTSTSLCRCGLRGDAASMTADLLLPIPAGPPFDMAARLRRALLRRLRRLLAAAP